MEALFQSRAAFLSQDARTPRWTSSYWRVQRYYKRVATMSSGAKNSRIQKWEDRFQYINFRSVSGKQHVQTVFWGMQSTWLVSYPIRNWCWWSNAYNYGYCSALWIQRPKLWSVIPPWPMFHPLHIWMSRAMRACTKKERLEREKEARQEAAERVARVRNKWAADVRISKIFLTHMRGIFV